MINLDKIPRIWKQAYLLLCLWYFVNFAISAILEYQLERPFSFVFWNALYLFEALCVLIVGILLYSHWLFRFNLYVQIAGHLIGAIAFFLIMGSLNYYLEDYLEGFVYFDQWKDHMIGLLRWEGLHFQNQYLITVAVFYIIRYFQRIQKREHEKAELALKNREMQLALLKSQINPHFLFNTLNSINTLINTSKEHARKVITQLSEIFRYALDAHSDQPVKLIHELDFIDNYIKIQQVRFGSRLKFVKDVDYSCLGAPVPPMILQPLIENAVKYGIAPKEEGGTITLTVKRVDSMIFFEVKDDGLGSQAKKVLDSSSTGVGLKNTDSRLRNTYGPEYGLTIHARTWGFSVSFFIPVSEEAIPHQTEMHSHAV